MAILQSGFSKLQATIMLLGAVICLDPAPLAAAHDPGDGQGIRKTVIADGIYQFTTIRDSYVRYLNSTVIVNENDVLVFDTNTRPSTARTILAEIRKITDKPVRYVVNSHHHPDHWSGNEVYAQAFPGLEIIASEQTLRYMQNIANYWPPRFRGVLKDEQASLDKEVSTGKQEDGTALTPEQRKEDEEDVRDYQSFVAEQAAVHRTYPTLTYVDKFTLLHGGREFRFMSVVGDAHGTTVLYLPKEKVLLTGDAVSYPMPYLNSLASRHAKSLRALAQLDVDVIIPGHGPAFHDKSFLNQEADLLEAVVGEVRAAAQQGTPVEEILKTVTLEEFRVKFTHNDPDLERRFRGMVKNVVQGAFAEARDGNDRN